jgi:hypothetical protein
MPASHSVPMDTSCATEVTHEERVNAGQRPDEELDALLARAEAELAGTGIGGCEPMVCGELDDRALGRRTASILRHRRSEEEDLDAAGVWFASVPRHRRSEEDLDAASVRFASVEEALAPPARFARKGRGVRLPPVEPEQRPERQPDRVEPERRSLVVSSVYASFRAATPQARIVRWSRKRKAPGEPAVGDDVARPAHGGARLERAKALAGSVVYI